jgi:TusA-related sulfurtransferase
MDYEQTDLVTKVCPYVVMYIIREAGKMRSGETRSFITDDPLALKSVPVELEEYDDLSVSVKPHEKGWELIISRT